MAIWDDRIDALVAECPDIPVLVADAARSLLSARGVSALQPDEIRRGYWPTICLVWFIEKSAIEIEVSKVDYEYCGPDEARLDIRHFPHEGGVVVEANLLALLPV